MTPGPAAADGGYGEVLVFRALKAAIQKKNDSIAAYGALQIIRPCKPRVVPGVIIVRLLRSYSRIYFLFHAD